MFMFSFSLSTLCGLVLDRELSRGLLCTSLIIKILVLLWSPPVGGASFMQFHHAAKIHTHTHRLPLFPVILHMEDAKHMKLHMRACTKTMNITPHARAAVYLPCATKHKVKPGRKRSAAVSTGVYFAADHISTLRSNRKHINLRKSSADIIDHNEVACCIF